MVANIKDIRKRALKSFAPKKRMSLSEYATSSISLSGEFSNVSGKLSLSLTPYLKEIMDAVSDPAIERVTWVSSAQTGKTTLAMSIASYFIEHEPSPILFLEPTDTLAVSISNERFAGIINSNSNLKSLLTEKGQKNNLTEKKFPGGICVFGSANSFGDLISRPIRVLILDEVDAYTQDLKEKGNPIKLSEDRTQTFPNRKIITVSTPGIKGMSNVMDAYNSSDMRVYKVPCPVCKHKQELVFKNVKWESEDGSGAYYECENCYTKIDSSKKHWMVSNGEWVKTNPESKNRHAGFYLNQLYSLFPNTSFENIAMRFVGIKRGGEFNGLKVFINSVLAETWDLSSMASINEGELMSRREHYTADVPMPCGVLFAGVDVQHDRIEITTLGFAKNNQVYLVDHHIIWGETAIDPDFAGPSIWKDLDLYLNRSFRHESGRQIYIRSAFIDVGDGTLTHIIRKFAFQRWDRAIFPIVGSRVGTDAPFSGRHTVDKEFHRPVYHIGVSNLKEELYHRLKIQYSNQSGYIHFPRDISGDKRYNHIGEDYFKQLTSERLEVKRKSGVIHKEWKKTQRRNEALDTFVYALACQIKFFKGNLALLDSACDEMAAEVVSDEPETASEASQALQSVGKIDPPTSTAQASAPFDFFSERQRLLAGKRQF